MRVETIRLRRLSLPLKAPFVTSFGRQTVRDVILVEAEAGGLVGWGESPTLTAPLYNEETVETAWHLLKDFLAPAVLAGNLSHPAAVAERLRPFRRNYIAKAGLEGAIWDLWARTRDQSVAQVLGGTRDRVAAGVSLGIAPAVKDLLGEVAAYLDQGYRRIKVKIKPGWDRVPLAAIRDRFGAIPLMADANSAYAPSDLPQLRAIDDLELMMIEQPLAADDLVDHAWLQSELATPLCLDESICSREDARKAVELGSCRIINIKAARVGGLSEAVAIHDLCRERGVPVWCGGMLETGIGRAHNLALASLPGFTLPGDISGSHRYWDRDVVRPEIAVDGEGYITVPAGPGLGHEPDRDEIARRTVREAVLKSTHTGPGTCG
jgi:O-succinylbenzoate synthase